jgi:eukaryotic-like serine/threonine-protein kinase
MGNQKRPWDDKWEFIRDISSGGQGVTSLVKPKGLSNVLGNKSFVLKRLIRQKDAERRKRMHREVSILKTLDHLAIPKLIDSNSEQFDDNNVPLYMVAEFVEGETLSKIVGKNSLELPEAIELMLKLLDIIQYCHRIGVIHRDIKPDNIMVRNGKLDDPVLIDFGISFNVEELTESSLTESLQQLGNRFIALPELHFKSSLQRDPRSDITQCCGILYYVLTGLHPVTLQDHQEQKPHQRADFKAHLSRLETQTLALLNRVFDRAFELSIDRRWQSVEELHDTLRRLNNQSKPEYMSNAEDSIARIKQQLLNSPDYVRRESFKILADKIFNEIRHIGSKTAKEFGEPFNTIQSGHGIDLAKMTFGEQFGIFNAVIPEKQFFPVFKGYATGNEIVLVSETYEQQIELLRVPLNTDPDFETFRERLREFYIEGVVRTLDT